MKEILPGFDVVQWLPSLGRGHLEMERWVKAAWGEAKGVCDGVCGPLRARLTAELVAHQLYGDASLAGLRKSLAYLWDQWKKAKDAPVVPGAPFCYLGKLLEAIIVHDGNAETRERALQVRLELPEYAQRPAP